MVRLPRSVAPRGGWAAGDRTGRPTIRRRVGSVACCLDGQRRRAAPFSNPCCVHSVLLDMTVLLAGYRDGRKREVGIRIGIIPMSAPVGRDGYNTRGCGFSSWRRRSSPPYIFPPHSLSGETPRAATTLLASCPSRRRRCESYVAVATAWVRRQLQMVCPSSSMWQLFRGVTLDLGLPDQMMTETFVSFFLPGASSWSSDSLERPTGQAVLHRPH